MPQKDQLMMCWVRVSWCPWCPSYRQMCLCLSTWTKLRLSDAFMTLCPRSLIWNQLNAVTSVSLSTRLSRWWTLRRSRLNVLCTDVNVGSVRWTGSPWRNVPVKHAVHACCPGNGESPVLDQNYQLLSHQLSDGQTRPRVGFKCTHICRSVCSFPIVMTIVNPQNAPVCEEGGVVANVKLLHTSSDDLV